MIATAGSYSNLHVYANSRHPLLDEVLDGLLSVPKRLSPHWFYDERGSELFEEICELPEYYPTRVELAIMRKHGAQIAEQVGADAALIEYGSGTSLKTRVLLDHLAKPACYAPVDIAETHLLDAAGAIAREYPELRVRPVCADFTRPFSIPDAALRAARRVIYFPGSTIGNFEEDTAVDLLRQMRRLAGRKGLVLIGIDLKKDTAILERAYNDARGVTAAFNLNALRHLNRVLRTHFDLSCFRHRAVWVERYSRIEMHLVSRCAQTVIVGDAPVSFDAGEPLVTEYSHKYSLPSFAQLAQRAELKLKSSWTDESQWFAVQMLEPA